MLEFNVRERTVLLAALRLFRHDVPHLRSETSELTATDQEFRWPNDSELDGLCEKLNDLAEPDARTSQRYVLYDFDANQLITTQVFDTHDDAAEHANQLTDVLILPLALPEATAGVAELADGPEGPCECELPGYFCSGVPGIIAHFENGRLVPGAAVERCDLCERFPTDEAARQKLVELGLA